MSERTPIYDSLPADVRMLVDIHEAWRPVPGYEGLYDVSDMGRVRSLMAHPGKSGARGRRRKEPLILAFGTAWGYSTVCLYRDGKSCVRVHRLVLTAFVGPPPEGTEGAHLNGDRSDNRLANLAWVSRKENARQRMAHGTQIRGEQTRTSKLTPEIVREIRRRYAVRRPGDVAKMAREFGIARQNVTRVGQGSVWKHIT